MHFRDTQEILYVGLETNDGFLESWDGKIIREVIDFYVG